MEKSDQVTTIYASSSHQRNTFGQKKARINYDPNNCWYRKDVDENGSRVRPPWVELGHELKHAVDHASGMHMEHPSKGNLGAAETRAVTAENNIRLEAGIPLRATYSTKWDKHNVLHLR